ncbi:unnamed protein product [Trifolium pratense]|uniref:Uncharacterized protein n=1 Tax=Trifolium pratense TaxID=57577 RepID=A0ACB0LRX6_TRIPR|nr:unnamed protein product [Trifolium pratense]
MQTRTITNQHVQSAVGWKKLAFGRVKFNIDVSFLSHNNVLLLENHTREKLRIFLLLHPHTVATVYGKSATTRKHRLCNPRHHLPPSTSFSHLSDFCSHKNCGPPQYFELAPPLVKPTPTGESSSVKPTPTGESSSVKPTPTGESTSSSVAQPLTIDDNPISLNRIKISLNCKISLIAYYDYDNENGIEEKGEV